MVLVDQNILITTEMIDNISGTVKVITKNVTDMNNGVRNVTQNIKQFSNGVVTTNQSLRSTTRGLQRFHFEWLSVMFVGMAINRVFGKYVKGAGEWLGATELMTEGLKLSVFTALEPFHDMIIGVSTALFDSSPAMQAFVGWVVIAGAVIGGILSVLGQFFLGMQGLKIIAPKLGPAILGAFKAIGAAIAGLGAATIAIVVAIIAAVIAVAFGIYYAFKENFMNIRLAGKWMIDGFKKMFRGLWNFIKGILKLIVAIFTLDFKGMWEAVKMIFKGGFDFIIGLVQGLVNLVVIISLGIVRVFKFIVDKVVGFFKWLYDKIVGHSIIPDMIKAIIAWFWKLPKAVFTMFKSIVSRMFSIGKNLMKGMVDGIKSIGSKVIDAILGLFPKWMRSGIKAAGRITINIIKSIKEKFTGGGSSNSKSKNDFIWRPGQGAVSINPNDTLVGFKGAPPNLGGGKGITFSPVYHINVSDKREFENLIKDNNVRMVEDLRRLIQT